VILGSLVFGGSVMSNKGGSADDLAFGIGKKVRSLVQGESALDESSIDELLTSTKLQSWQEAQLPQRWRFSSYLPIVLILLFLLTIFLVP